MPMRLLLLLSAGALVSGCYARYRLPPEAASELSGYDSHKEVVVKRETETLVFRGGALVGGGKQQDWTFFAITRLHHPNGRVLEIDSRTRIGFDVDGASSEPARWNRLLLDDTGHFHGEPANALSAPLDVELSHLSAVTLEKKSRGRSLLIAAAGLGALGAGLFSTAVFAQRDGSLNLNAAMGLPVLGLGVGAVAAVIALISPFFGWNLDADGSRLRGSEGLGGLFTGD
jgi:hypothetical protein